MQIGKYEEPIQSPQAYGRNRKLTVWQVQAYKLLWSSPLCNGHNKMLKYVKCFSQYGTKIWDI